MNGRITFNEPVPVHINNAGATGWWLYSYDDHREAMPMSDHCLSTDIDAAPAGFTYLAADVIRFINAGTLPCQLTGADDHG